MSYRKTIPRRLDEDIGLDVSADIHHFFPIIPTIKIRLSLQKGILFRFINYFKLLRYLPKRFMASFKESKE